MKILKKTKKLGVKIRDTLVSNKFFKKIIAQNTSVTFISAYVIVRNKVKRSNI